MKVFNRVTLCFLSFVSFNIAAAATFTNITTLSDKLVVAGVKSVEPGMEMVSHLLEVDAHRMSSRKIKLPSEIDSREVVGLFPTQKDMILVLTQITRGGGDKPQIHSYDTTKNTWKKLGEVDCISFSKVSVSAKDLEFSCEETSDAGKVSMVVKKFPVVTELKAQGVTLPVTKIEKNKLKASLEGEEFEWNKLKVTQGKKEKVFTP